MALVLIKEICYVFIDNPDSEFHDNEINGSADNSGEAVDVPVNAATDAADVQSPAGEEEDPEPEPRRKRRPPPSCHICR